MDEFYAQRIQAEIERIADCSDAEMLGVQEETTEEEIIHAYETHLKNLGTNKCGYSPETRELARELFYQLRKAAEHLGVDVQHIDEHYSGITQPPPSAFEDETPTETEEETVQAGSSFPVIVGESDEYLSATFARPPTTPASDTYYRSSIPTPFGPTVPLMSSSSSPPPLIPTSRGGSPPFGAIPPRAMSPTPTPSFPPGVPYSPGMLPINESYPPRPGSQAWATYGSVSTQQSPAFDVLQKRAETAEQQLTLLRGENAKVTSETVALRTKLKAAATIVEELTKRLKTSEKHALMLRNSRSEIKAKLAAFETDQ